jgi:hypothetical protein
MNNFNEVLNSLNELNYDHDIFIPSLNRKVSFKGLTAKQQKEILQTVVDKDVTGLSFSILVTDIIQNNIVDKTVSLLSSDKNYVIVCLRVLSLSNKYKDLDDVEYDLQPILSNNIALSEQSKNTVLNDGALTVTVATPTLAADRTINIETKKRILAQNTASTELTKDAIGELYLNEIIKYISNVKTPKIDVQFNDLTFNQKVQIAEKLPLSITSKIVEFINKSKDFEKTLFTVNNKEIKISVDPALFTL